LSVAAFIVREMQEEMEPLMKLLPKYLAHASTVVAWCLPEMALRVGFHDAFTLSFLILRST
jgi:hypothetical protein